MTIKLEIPYGISLILLISNVLLPFTGIYAQHLDTNDLKPSKIDTNYIKDYKDLLTARIYLLYQDESYLLFPGNSNEIIYTPNVSGRIGIAGFYKWFGLGLSLGSSAFRRSDDTYGHTSVIDWRINAYGNAVAAELFMQSLKGFYIQDYKDPMGNLYKEPDMKVFSLGLNAYWIYNHERFSIRAAFIQNERQIKSAGSLMIRPSIMYFNLSSDNGIVPAELAETQSIPKDLLVKNGDYYSLGLAPGYAYTFVFLRKAYLSAAVFPGVLWQTFTYNTEEGSSSSTNFSFNFSFRAAAGYNSDSWYIGAGIVRGVNKVPGWIGNARFYYDLAQFRVWGGTRFDWFRKKK